jgi:lysyl-tRNA synthetase class 1
MMQGNIEKINALIKRLNMDYDPSSVAERVPKAQAWLREYNQEEIISLRDDVNAEYVAGMSEDAKNLVRQFGRFLADADIETLSVEKLEEILYHIPKIEGLAGSELKKSQRAFFKDLYQLLISKDTGPRLATFVWGVEKDRILKLLEI